MSDIKIIGAGSKYNLEVAFEVYGRGIDLKPLVFLDLNSAREYAKSWFEKTGWYIMRVSKELVETSDK